MKNLLPKFSHIYIEKDAFGYPLTDLALSKFPKATLIEIDHYKDIFNRTHQDFQIQKGSMKLVLAKKTAPFLYKASDIIQDYGEPNIYYNTPILNCLYNCDYCFLQGMYPSGNMVVFVNENDFHPSVSERLNFLDHPSKPMILSISYNTDLMAMENIIPLTSRWIDFARDQRNLKIEIRTKSALFSSLKELKPTENIILSWTLSPQEICERYESTAPPFHLRLKALKQAIESGWAVRLCIDPVLIVKNWEDIYTRFITEIFSEIDGDALVDLTLGVFRMGKDYFNRIRKREPKSDLFYSKYILENGVVTIPNDDREFAMEVIKKQINHHAPNTQILIW